MYFEKKNKNKFVYVCIAYTIDLSDIIYKAKTANMIMVNWISSFL